MGGRRKGTPNKVTAEARAVCAVILDDPTYRTNLTARARAGTLAPAADQTDVPSTFTCLAPMLTWSAGITMRRAWGRARGGTAPWRGSSG